MKNREEKMNWYNVTLSQFLRLSEASKIEDEDERVIALAEAVYGDKVTELPVAEFVQKVKQLDFLKNEIPEGIPPKKLEVNGRKYYVDCLLGNITTAQYVDYTNHSKTSDMAKMLSVFIIPEEHKYNDGYDMLQVFSDIEDLPIPVVNSIAFFFCKQFEKFITIFRRCSIRNIRRTKLPRKLKKSMIEVVKKSLELMQIPLEYSHL